MAQQRVEKAFKAATDAKKIQGVAGIALDKDGNTLFKGAYGVTDLSKDDPKPMTTSTPVMIWSCTKIVTTVCALQLVEQGKLKLDDLVEKYVPEIKDIKVIEGFNDDGSPKLREPKTKATILMLMTHTAGFTYDFFDQKTLDYRAYTKQAPHGYASGEKYFFFDTPLLFDPGSKYTYGINTDWLGFVVEAISGMKLNDYVQEHVLNVLGLKNTGPLKKDGSFVEEGLIIHHRGEDGSLTANPEMKYAENPGIHGGGHFLYSTLDDYSTFLLALLNGGTEPRSGAQILKKETVSEYLFEDQIHKICSSDGIGLIETTAPAISVEGEFLPGLKKGWSCGLMLNPEGSSKGRSAGSGSWAGLGNLYYWLDPKEGKLGLIAAAILPFMDAEVLHLFDELERAMYGHEPSKEIGEVGGNYGLSKL